MSGAGGEPELEGFCGAATVMGRDNDEVVGGEVEIAAEGGRGGGTGRRRNFPFFIIDVDITIDINNASDLFNKTKEIALNPGRDGGHPRGILRGGDEG